MHSLLAMIWAWRLRFVSESACSEVKAHAAMLAWGKVAICLRYGSACGCNALCDEEWPNELPSAKHFCDFACHSKM